jgi:hypothetical protein
MSWRLDVVEFQQNVATSLPGADPGFQVRGGAIKKMRRAKGGGKIFGVFRVKNHDFTPKNHIFFNCRGRRENFWGISCEKSRFYAKKIIFFPILGGACAGCAPPWIRPCLLYTVTDQHYKILYQQITMLCHHKITKTQLDMTSKHNIPIGKRNIIIFGINTISDRHYIMTGRLAIIITQHKIKTRRPPITIDKCYTHGTTTCH